MLYLQKMYPKWDKEKWEKDNHTKHTIDKCRQKKKVQPSYVGRYN